LRKAVILIKERYSGCLRHGTNAYRFERGMLKHMPLKALVGLKGGSAFFTRCPGFDNGTKTMDRWK
jgi:hypothetical protein